MYFDRNNYTPIFFSKQESLLLFLHLVQIFFPGSHPAADMTLLLVHVKNLSGAFSQRRIKLKQTLCNVLVDRTFAHLELPGGLADGCVVFNDVVGYGYSTFFYITFQGKISRKRCFYNVCREHIIVCLIIQIINNSHIIVLKIIPCHIITFKLNLIRLYTFECTK